MLGFYIYIYITTFKFFIILLGWVGIQFFCKMNSKFRPDSVEILKRVTDPEPRSVGSQPCGSITSGGFCLALFLRFEHNNLL
jgi:hypothetical protein